MKKDENSTNVSKCQVIIDAIDGKLIRDKPRKSKESWFTNVSLSQFSYRFLGLIVTISYSTFRLRSKYNGNQIIMKDGLQVAFLANGILIFDDLFRSIVIESKGAKSLYGKSLMLELSNPNSFNQIFSIDEQKMYVLQKSFQVLEWLTILNLWKRSNFIFLPIVIFQSLYLLEWELKKYKEIYGEK